MRQLIHKSFNVLIVVDDELFWIMVIMKNQQKLNLNYVQNNSVHYQPQLYVNIQIPISNRCHTKVRKLFRGL